jgi:CheY-like chemotaxis protein
VDHEPEPLQGLDLLYVAIRNGAVVDRQAAFDVATDDLGYLPRHIDAGQVADAARELAEASLADDDARLATAASALLAARGYEPGFTADPERLARLERALDVVRTDLRASGLTGEVRLVRPTWYPSNAAVQTWAGDTGWTTGVFASEAADDLSALVAVAEQTRQAVMESLDYQSTGAVWPACLEHGRSVSPEAREERGVWWCDGTNDGHVLAEIGKLPECSWIRKAPVGRRRPLSTPLRDNRDGERGTRA